jgi:PST family polysaccharide transporter
MDVLKNTIPAMISSAIMGLAGYLLQGLNNSFVWQFASIFICIIVYFAVLFLLFPKTRNELLNTAYAKKFISKFKR